MSSKFIVPLKLLEINATPAFIVSDWHNLYYKAGYLKTYKTSEKDVVLDRPLDGFAPTVCTPIVATDTVLEAFEKVQCQINNIPPPLWGVIGGTITDQQDLMDLLDNYQLNLCDNTLPFKEGTVGPKVSFIKQNFADPNIAKDIIIPGALEITRGLDGGIYNIAVESSYNWPGPAYTEWSSENIDVDDVTWAPLENIFNRTYQGWGNTFSYGPGLLVGSYVIMKYTPPLSLESRYWLIKFTSWTPGNSQGVSGGGGFSYDRWEITGPVYFTRPANQSTIVDTISPGVVIGRDDTGGGLYNIIDETQSKITFSPRNTKWNSVYTDGRSGYSGFLDLTNIRKRLYKDFIIASGYNVNNSSLILNTQYIMHDLTTDLYYMIKFTNWTTNGNGGAFSYTRQIIPESCGVKFADGTVLNSGNISLPNIQQIVNVSGSSLYSTNPAAGPNFSTSQGVFLGQSAGQNSGGSFSSISIGTQAGSNAYFAGTSVFLGYYAGYMSSLNYSSFSNSVFIGASAGSNASNCYDTVALGYLSGSQMSNSDSSVNIGRLAAWQSGNSRFGIFIGNGAGAQTTNNFASVFIGSISGWGGATYQGNYFGSSTGNTSGSEFSAFVGDASGAGANQATWTVGLGPQAGAGLGGYQTKVNGGSYNIYIGAQCGSFSNTSVGIITMGYRASLYLNNSNHINTIGSFSGSSSYLNNYATFIGYNAGSGSHNLSNSTFIGTNAGTNAVSSNVTAIGTNVAQGNAIPDVVILASSQLQSYPDEIAAQAGFAALGTLVAGNSYLFYNTTTKCIGVVKY